MQGRFEQVRASTGAYARRLAWVLAVALVIASVIVAERRVQQTQRASTGSSAPATPAPDAATAHSVTSASTPIGWIDAPAGDTIVGPRVSLSGWALDAAGIRAVELRIAGQAFEARHGIARPDVLAAKPGYPDGAPGFEVDVDLSASLAASADGRRVVDVVAINRQGGEALLGRRNVVLPLDASPWRTLYTSLGAQRPPPFYFLPGVSGIPLGGAHEIDTVYTAYVSPTVATGMRVPILYMRTTLGAKKDWRFDPDWDIARRCGERRIAEDSLNALIAYARKHRVPVLFTLNGGVWADASCGVPQWDATDHLEQDKRNCQWNERGEVMDDDYLKHLPGAQESPELGRMLTYNVYAGRNRHYKKRNLQAAARIIMEFARAEPDLFVGINLDPDTGMVPFFEMKQWYDYNPGTLRQFRHWLAGTGPYRGESGRGVPDLRAYRRSQPLTLDEVNRLSGRAFKRWDDVDPPRTFALDGDKPFWQDPWTHEWEVFRRHLVDLHYDELSQWLADVGVPSQRIFSSQGFMAPHHKAMPFALRVDSPTKNYDTAGISVEGAVPSRGHLGAVVYGPAVRNQIPMETSDSLYAAFHRLDPGWGIVEFNTADLRTPNELPTYAMAYAALRDDFNFGARLMSPMAWNGSNGLFAGQPGYVSFMAWRNTPLEEAMRDFALSHAYVPVGSRLWTFGSDTHASDDGWSTSAASVQAGNGVLHVQPQASEFALLSPSNLAIRRGEVGLVVIGIDAVGHVTEVRIELRDAAGNWIAAGASRAGSTETNPAGLVVPLDWPPALASAEQVRLVVALSGDKTPVALRHIALYRARN
jgi:hypothetical protein